MRGMVYQPIRQISVHFPNSNVRYTLSTYFSAS